jgi:DNA-binding MarR family transcriptional regulator
VVVTLSELGRETLLADRARRDAWLARKLQDLTAEERAVLRRAAPILEQLAQKD